MKKKPEFYSNRVQYLEVDRIAPNAQQPRRQFSTEGLQELAQSITAYGILQPLTVRKQGKGYELVAGERRLRAAKLAGLEEVPCVLLDIGLEDSSQIAMIENLQRQDLDFIEEAVGLHQLIRIFGLSQEEAAKKIGKSQSAVANKLRLLKLPDDVLKSLRDNGLTERHGRALLRLGTPQKQRQALEYILAHDMTVAAAEVYIDGLLKAPPVTEEKQEKPKRSFVLKDVRVFLNTVSRSIDLMKQGGINAGMEKKETDDELILTISIPKCKNTENSMT